MTELGIFLCVIAAIWAGAGFVALVVGTVSDWLTDEPVVKDYLITELKRNK